MPCPTHKPASAGRSRYADVYQSAAFRRLRKEVLDEQRQCPGYPPDNPIRCGMRTTHVDHIVALADGGAELDRTNLQALCASCSGRKSVAERMARRRGPTGGRGVAS
jgi:5-methylcytosine-specific restriction endonuclease McrA